MVVKSDDLDADRREPTMTLTGWRRFVDTPAAAFELLPADAWQQVTEPDRTRYDEARITTTHSWSWWPRRACARSPGRVVC
jgi:hypothetical protein